MESNNATKLMVNVPYFVFIVTVFSFLFLPSIPLGGFGLRIDDVTLLLIVPFLIFYYKKIFFDSFSVSILILLLLIIFSTIRGYFVLDVPASFQDANELFKLSKPFFLALLMYYVSLDKLELSVKKVFYYGSFFIVFIGFVEYFNFLGLGDIFSKFFTSDSQIESALASDGKRVTLTGSNPNDGAIIAAYFFLFNFFYYIYTRKKFFLFLIFLLLLMIFFTSSRTVLLAILISLSLFFIFSGSFNIFKKVLIYSSLLLIIYFLVPYFSYIYKGIEEVSAGQNTSLIHRLQSWDEAYSLFLESPFFGWGPAKEIHSTIVDGEYFMFIRRYGFAGMLMLMFVLFLPLFVRKKTITKTCFENVVYSSLVYMVPVGLIVMMTNNFFSGYQSFLGFSLLFVLYLRLSKVVSYD